MTPGTALRLARSSAPGETRRRALIAGSVAAAGALLLYAVHLARGTLDWSFGLARYVTEDGLRGGTMAAALLLAVPVLALTVQALRMGSTARDRRMQALRLAGATPGELRAVAAAEAGRAAGVGGLLVAPAYVLLWFVAGVLPPWGWKLVDRPDAGDAITWLVLVPALAFAGAGAGAVLQARAAQSARPGRANLIVLAAGVLVIAASLSQFGDDAVDVLLFTAIAGLLVVGFASGPWLVLGGARLLARRGSAESLLAARRLRADPRSAGRVAGVLVVCGVALSLEALFAIDAFRDDQSDTAFYAGGFALAGAAMVVAAAVAVLALLLGTADGLLSARRPLATAAVLGVDVRVLSRVLSLQLLATAVPAIALGALLGGATLALLANGLEPGVLPAVGWTLLLGAGTAFVVGGALALVTRVSVWALRPLVRAAIDPENLRAA